MFVEVLVLGITLIAFMFYKISINHARYFKERNIKCNGVLQSVKGFMSLFLGKYDAFQITQNTYNTFPDEQIFGMFDFTIRQYVIRDPEVYKQIAIKDFDHFENRRSVIDEKMDELFGNSLISMKGEKWRQMRATLSPAFTGSKMRQMFELVSECADDVVKHYLKQAEKGEKVNIEIKDFFSRYTNDVIATCAFGIKVNSHADRENEFFTNGKKFMDFSGFWMSIKIFFLVLIPKVAKRFNISFSDRSLSSSFKNMILDTMDMRQKNKIHRPDVINMLMQVREGKVVDLKTEAKSNETEGFATVEESEVGKANVNRKWNDNELAAQCFLFFLAGFDTSSNALTFAAYEIMVNPDIQQRLYEEISEVNDQLSGKRVTYDVIQKMKYLDQVISETLRKYPIAGQTDRECVKDYVYDDGERKFTIEKESVVIFSLYGVHHDPKYYADPEKFDPERFSDENKHNIKPGTYVPFGVGPRNCIGSRFALMELKAILYYLLLNFSFEPNKDTQIPLKLRKGFILQCDGGHMELKPRVK